MLNLTPRPLYSWGNSPPPRAHCMGGWGGPERLSECYGEDGRILFLPGTESLFLDFPARNVVAIPTELPHSTGA
jgi:hypothetical protein